MRTTTRSLLIVAICILIGSAAAGPVRANAAPPPDPDVGGLAPYQPQKTNVQMLSESVLVDVLPNPDHWISKRTFWAMNLIRVKASFSMQNQGSTEEQMQVVFPLTRLDYPWVTSSYSVIGSSFVAKVDGQIVPTTRTSTPPELIGVPEDQDATLPPDGRFTADVQWAAFDVTFPVRQPVLLEVEYMMNGFDLGLRSVDYIVETGAGWYGAIGSADITVRLPYPATRESVKSASPGYTFSGNEVRWSFTNFAPTRADNLNAVFFNTDMWPPILEYRARVQAEPQDAEAWYTLGSLYADLALLLMGGTDQYLVDLSIDAYETAISLQPDWGQAHAGLANILWFSSPGVLDLQNGRGGQEITLEDPVMQRAVQELELAGSYGAVAEYNDLALYMRNRLQLTLPPLPTPTPPTAGVRAQPAALSGTPLEPEAIVAGKYDTCILRADTGIRCRGLLWETPLDIDLSGDFQAMAVGDGFICLLSRSGGVSCLGRNTYGQLGDGTTTDRVTPADVSGLTEGVISLAAGNNHACARTSGGGVTCWGRNYFGQLGNGSTAYSLFPVEVDGLTGDILQLAAGNDHTCAISQDEHGKNHVQCWGANALGQLGDGSRVDRLTPVEAVGLPEDVSLLTAGQAHTCTLTSTGGVLCWGDNRYGQLGDGSTVDHITAAIVPGLERGVQSVGAGNGFTCALTAQQAVQCWGDNRLGQLGDGDGDGDGKPVARSTPAEVPGLTGGVRSLALGDDHACALMIGGGVKCWGLRSFGPDGYGGSGAGPLFRPKPVDALELGFQQVSNDGPARPAATSTPLPADTGAQAPLPGMDLAWPLGLSAALAALVFLIWRTQVRGRK